MPAVLRNTITLAASLLLCACAGADKADAVAAPAAAPAAAPGQEQAALPAVAELKQLQCLDPGYFTGAHLIAWGGDAEPDNDQLRLGTAVSGGGSAKLSYGIWQRHLGGGSSNVGFSTSSVSPLPEPGPYWVAVANYKKQVWEWLGPYTTPLDNIPLSDSTSYGSGWGDLYVAVAVEQGYGCTLTEVSSIQAGGGSEEGPPEDALALCVGPGRQYARIEDALAAAADGAQIKIYPQAGNAPYVATALFITKSGLSFWGMRTADSQRPVLSGTGYNYTGAGSTPRAIFQFQPGADNCRVSGLELYDAHNDSYNGAGIRVNQAKNIQIDDCLIHGCDMGLMSNGDAVAGTGSLSLVECRLYENGSELDPGYNHNIYAGGTRLSMTGCEVYGSLTGHNVKSRAHINEIRACYIHDSSNREFDLVDEAGNTGIADSYSLISGCIIEKADPCDGNRGVIHFGQDGGNDHNGTLYLCNNTIVTPYISAVVQLSAVNAKLAMYNCILWDGGSGQAGQVLAAASSGADIANAMGEANWLSSGFSIPPGSNFSVAGMHFAGPGVAPPFVDSAGGDYRLLPAAFEFIVDAGLSEFFPTPGGEGGAPLSIVPNISYRPDFCTLPRQLYGDSDIGAYESEYGK